MNINTVQKKRKVKDENYEEKEKMLLKNCMNNPTLTSKLIDWDIYNWETDYTRNILYYIYKIQKENKEVSIENLLYVSKSKNDIEPIKSLSDTFEIRDKEWLNSHVRDVLYKEKSLNEVNEYDNHRNVDYILEKNKDMYSQILSFDVFGEEDDEFKCMSAVDFINLDIPERQVILSPWLKEKTITIVNAAKGVGKTQFVWGIMNAVSKNVDFGLWKGTDKYKCLFVDAELPYEVLKERLPYHKLGKNVLIRSVIWENDRKKYPGLLRNQQYRDFIEKFCIYNEVKLLVLDNKKSIAPGLEENSSNEWDEINEWLLEMRGKGYSIILVTHGGKDESKGIRGHSGIEDNVDYTISLKDRKLDSDYVRFSYKFDKVRDFISYQYTKSKILTFVPDENGKYEWKIEDDEEMMLDYIKKNPDKTQTELANDLGISQPKISRLKKKISE